MQGYRHEFFFGGGGGGGGGLINNGVPLLKKLSFMHYNIIL